ncbi:MAG: thioredoxin [Acutalibacteraceae bacterium]
MSYINVDNNNFKAEVLSSEIPVLVDFWAPWCRFCLMISDDIEEIADDFDGRIKVCKLNCDDAEELALSYSISSIPALVLFENGSAKATLVGPTSKEQIADFIEDNTK